MLRRQMVITLVLLIVISFFGMLLIISRKSNDTIMNDHVVVPSVAEELVTVPPTSIIQPTQSSGTQAYTCHVDSDCGAGKCIEEQSCPPCLSGDPFAQCTCVTVGRCHFDNL